MSAGMIREATFGAGVLLTGIGLWLERPSVALVVVGTFAVAAAIYSTRNQRGN